MTCGIPRQATSGTASGAVPSSSQVDEKLSNGGTGPRRPIGSRRYRNIRQQPMCGPEVLLEFAIRSSRVRGRIILPH